MKVILTKFVKDLGREGDIVEVSDGYAVNLLFPRGLAKQATAVVLNKHKMAQKSAKIHAEKEIKSTLTILEKFNNQTVVCREKLNSKGKLYHALGLKEIIRAVGEQYNIELSDKLFKESYSFREAGKYSLELEAYEKKIKINLVIEEK